MGRIYPDSDGEPEIGDTYFSPLTEVWSESARLASIEARRKGRSGSLGPEKIPDPFNAKSVSQTDPSDAPNVSSFELVGYSKARMLTSSVYYDEYEIERMAKAMVSEVSDERFAIKVYLDTYSDPMIHLQFTGSKGTVLKRDIYHNVDGDLEVDHHIFRVSKDRQGSGIAGQILGPSFREYAKMKVKLVTLTANIDVGGYAWAKFGFIPSDFRSAMFTVTHENHHLLSKSEISDVHVTIRDTEPHKVMWALSDKPYGKRLLAGIDWKAHLYLDGRGVHSQGVTRFKDYVVRKKAQRAEEARKKRFEKIKRTGNLDRPF